jgi:hypothetical protein
MQLKKNESISAQFPQRGRKPLPDLPFHFLTPKHGGIPFGFADVIPIPSALLPRRYAQGHALFAWVEPIIDAVNFDLQDGLGFIVD